MKFYLASAYSLMSEMRRVRAILQALGHDVTSHWIDGIHDADTSPEYAQEDVDDVAAADAVISFTGYYSKRSRGGRHVEFGIGLALGKRMIIIGPPENVFHTLPQIQVYCRLEEFLESELLNSEFALAEEPSR